MKSSKVLEISLVNLVYRILKHWRAIIICMVISAILFNFWGYYKSTRNAASIKQTIDDYNSKMSSGNYDNNGNEVVPISEFEKRLSTRQIYEVNSLLEGYKVYQEPRKDIEEYTNNSILMQVDSNSVPTYTVQYLIDTHYTVEYPEINKKDYTSDIQNSVANSLLDMDLYEEIAASISTADSEVKPAYVSELFNITPNADTIIIKIYARNEDECKAIYSITEKKLNTVFKDLQKIYGDFDYVLLSEQYSETCNENVLNAQKNKGDAYSTFHNNFQARLVALNEDQKSYFYAMLNNDDTVAIIPDKNDTETNKLVEPKTMVVPSVSIINPKYIVVGAFLGLILVCGWIFLITILCGCLLSGDDMNNIFNLSQLGVWRVSKAPKGIFSFIDKWLINLLDSKGGQFTPEESLEMIAAGIRISARKNDWKNIYLTSTANDELTQDSLSTLADKLNGMIDNIDYGKSIVFDPESLERSSNSDAIVLLEKINTSKITEIQTEYNLCNKYNIPIIGYVTLK